MERTDYIQLHQRMLEIRIFEERAAELYLQGDLPGLGLSGQQV